MIDDLTNLLVKKCEIKRNNEGFIRLHQSFLTSAEAKDMSIRDLKELDKFSETIYPLGGASISNVADQAIEFCKYYQTVVIFDFNGIIIKISPYSKIEEIIDYYFIATNSHGALAC